MAVALAACAGHFPLAAAVCQLAAADVAAPTAACPLALLQRAASVAAHWAAWLQAACGLQSCPEAAAAACHPCLHRAGVIICSHVCRHTAAGSVWSNLHDCEIRCRPHHASQLAVWMPPHLQHARRRLHLMCRSPHCPQPLRPGPRHRWPGRSRPDRCHLLPAVAWPRLLVALQYAQPIWQARQKQWFSCGRQAATASSAVVRVCVLQKTSTGLHESAAHDLAWPALLQGESDRGHTTAFIQLCVKWRHLVKGRCC